MKRLAIALVALMIAAPCYAARPLKEDTAVTIIVGPFVDTAGAAVTAPTIANIDITAYKNDGTAVTITPAASGTSNDMAHVDDGYYSLELTATDTSTPGYLRLTFQISGALIFHEDFDVQSPNVYNALTAGTSRLVIAAQNTWYVDDGGSDSNDGRTPATAFATLGAAQTAATQGDTIIVLPGTYSGNFTITKDGLTFKGVDKRSCTLTHTAHTIDVQADFITIEGLTINATGAEDGAVAIYARDSSVYGLTIRRCTTSGKIDSIDCSNSTNTTIEENEINGTWDCINVAQVKDVKIHRNIIVCDGSYTVLGNVVSCIAGGQFLGGSLTANRQVALITNNEIRLVTSAARTGKIVGINFGGLAQIEGNKIVVQATSGSASGNVEGIGDVTGGQAAIPMLRSNMIVTSNSGSGTASDIVMAHADGQAELAQTMFDPAKVSGDVREVLQPTTVGRKLDITATGAAGIDLANVENQGTTLNLTATTIKDATDLNVLGASTNTRVLLALPNAAFNDGSGISSKNDLMAEFTNIQSDVDNVFTRLGPPAGADFATDIAALPTAAENATALLNTVLTDTGATELGRTLFWLHNAFGGDGQFDANALSLGPTGAGAPVAADVVGPSYTWIGQRYRATNIVEVGDNFEGTLALKPDINPGTTIATVDSVSITGAAVVTATDLTVDRSRTKAHFTVPTLTVTGTYTVVVTVTTVDGQTIPTTATLMVR